MPNKTKLKASGYMPNKIKIPRELLTSTISLLESLDIEDYSPETIQLYGYVLYAFNKKKENIELREAYAKFIHVEDLESRFESDTNHESQFYGDEPF